MLEAIVRAGEVVAMGTGDVDLTRGLAIVQRGKGGKGRPVPFGPQTGRAIDRYLRLRRSHRLAETPALWLSDRGKNLSYDGLYAALKYRAELAGIADFHPHVTRHAAAQRWLSAEGSEGGLMAVTGWTRRDMIDHPAFFAKAAAVRSLYPHPPADELVLGHPHPHREQVEYLPPLRAHLRRAGQVRTTSTAGTRLVPQRLVRVGDLRQRRARMALLPARLPTALAPNDFGAGLANGESDDSGFEEFRLLCPNCPRNSATSA